MLFFDRSRRVSVYKRNVLRLFETMFSPMPVSLEEQEKIWNEWITAMKEAGDLSAFSHIFENEGIDRVYKARAIAVILAPDFDYQPFLWGDGGFPYESFSFLSQLKDPKLIDFSCEIILMSASELLLLKNGDVSKYNKYILYALSHVDEDDPRNEAFADTIRLRADSRCERKKDQSGTIYRTGGIFFLPKR